MNIRKHYRKLVSALAVASALAAGTAYASTPEHKLHHGQRVIRLTEKSDVPKLTYVDIGDPGLSPGDTVTTHDEVLRKDGGASGVLRQTCTMTEPGASLLTSTYECVGSIAFPEGTITFQGPFVPVQPATGAITGGTGSYQAAAGEADIHAQADQIVLRLAT
jgi:Allene oxide cyclase barrel like domain